MTRKGVLSAVLTATVGIVLSCGRGFAPSAPTTPTPIELPVTILSAPGFDGGMYFPDLVAAPSLVDLLGLVHAVGAHPSFDDCIRVPGLRSECWLDVKDPGDTLLIGAILAAGCTNTDSVSAQLSDPKSVTIIATHSGGCGRGGAAGSPEMTLLGIPLAALSPTEIRITLTHVGASAPSSDTVVDLRRPLDLATDARSRMNETIAAITLAGDDAIRRVGNAQISFAGVGTDRWNDTALGCPTPGRTYKPTTAQGYVVFLRRSDQPQSRMEYHVSASTQVFCGLVS